MSVVEVSKDPTLNWWIRQHSIVVDVFSWYKKNGVGAMIELEDMIILDIINTWKNDTIFIDQKKWTKWFGPAMREVNRNGSVPFYSKISIVIYIFIGLFILSFAASLYTKAITFLSPLLLYGLIKIVSGGRYFIPDERDQRLFLNNYYRAFTWIGIYLYALNRRRRKVFEPFFIGAHVLFVVVIYLIYIGLTKMCNSLVAWKPVNPETMSNLCGMISGVELGCVFFIRSKQGLYFVPKIIYLSIAIFLVYINLTVYGFYALAMKMMCSFGFAYWFAMVILFEAQVLHLPGRHLEKPSNDRPRVLYQPLFGLTWFHDLPPFWTMFLPYYDRSCFTDDEMSLVDQRWPQMNAYISNFNNELLRPTVDGIL